MDELLHQYFTCYTSGADLDLTARGGIAAHEVHGKNFGHMASLLSTQRTYVYDN